MTFSPELEKRFADLLTHYPEGRQKAALIPMLMYGQDEVGSVSPELMAEVAKRLNIGCSTLYRKMKDYGLEERELIEPAA